MTSEAQLKAVKKYKEKVKRTTVDFHPTESDLWEHLQSQKKKQTYLKALIRADMDTPKQNGTKVRTVTQYAALAQRADGSFFKLHSFTLKGKAEAELVIASHKARFVPTHEPIEYKIVQRTVTYAEGEWSDLELR